MAEDSFKKAIQAANSGQRFPVMSLVRNDPGMAAMLSKLVTDRETPRYDNAGNREPVLPNMGLFKTTSERTAQGIADAKTVMQILPDMELAASILVSSILSPKDMMTTELTYSIGEGLIAPDVSAAMIAKTKSYFEQVYKIDELLPDILRDVLFNTGSYAAAIIPENSIDEVINNNNRIGLEQLADAFNHDGSLKSLGLLGPVIKSHPTPMKSNVGLSMEAMNSYVPDTKVDGTITLESAFQLKVETFTSVTDNINLLKIPRINQKIREQRIINSIRSKALESFSPLASVATGSANRKLNDREITNILYKERQFSYKPITSLKTQEQLNRHTVGNPLVMHLPSESVIPVYVPGSPEVQVGFFVLIDEHGNPVSRAQNVDYYNELSNRLNSNGSFPSAMLNKVRGMMEGFDYRNKESIDFTARAYGTMIEQDLLARLRNGIYGNGVALAKKEEVYRIMLARALAKQHTQLLFVPVELMTYFAFRFNEDGIGKSLMDDMKILNSLRSMLTFANVMASLRNSIGRTNVNVKLDETDPNPQKSIEIAMHEIMRSRQQYFPLGMNSPTDITDWLQRAGFEFTWEGHAGLPDVKIDFNEKNSNYVKPDSDLEESLRKRAIMAVGLSPETVDATFQAEFATSVVTNNILLSKRVMQIQGQFTPLLSEHLRKWMMNSENLVKELREILENNFDKLKPTQNETDDAKKKVVVIDQSTGEENPELLKGQIVNQFLNEFIMSFEVSLPAPNSATLENQLAALETYTKALDQTLDAYLSDRFFTSDVGGDVANQVSTIKEVLKAYFVRQWLAENGVMTELSNLTNVDQDGKPAVDVWDIQQSHLENLTKTLTKFMFGLNKIKEASNTIMDSIGGAGEAPASSSSDSDTSGGDDLGGGTDDFGSSPDFGSGLEEEPDNTAPAEDEGTGTSESTTDTSESEPTKEEKPEETKESEEKKDEGNQPAE